MNMNNHNEKNSLTYIEAGYSAIFDVQSAPLDFSIFFIANFYVNQKFKNF